MSASWPYLWDGCRDGALAMDAALDVVELALAVARVLTARREVGSGVPAHDWGVRRDARVPADARALFWLYDCWGCLARRAMCRKA